MSAGKVDVLAWFNDRIYDFGPQRAGSFGEREKQGFIEARAALAELIEAAEDCAHGYNHPRLRAALARIGGAPGEQTIEEWLNLPPGGAP